MKLRPPFWKKGKTYKRPYTGSRRFDRTCRNHGSCPYCKNNRLHNVRKKLYWTREEINQEA